MVTYKQLIHFSFHAIDRDIGRCKNILFNDEDFVVRYLQADTNTWLPLSRKVVISPISITRVAESDEQIYIGMSSEALKNSPSIDEHKPVSREYEALFSKYFGYGYYWVGPGTWGEYAHPTELVDKELKHLKFAEELTEQQEGMSNHLRECSEIESYKIQTLEGQVGHISDFVFDTSSWAMPLLVVDTHNWWPGGRSLALHVRHIKEIDWATHTVHVNLSEKEMKELDDIDVSSLCDSKYCLRLLSK